MKIFDKKEELKHHLDNFRKKKKSIGFVPTMGALHAGHIALIENAKKENDVVVCSIFVNPTQFNNKEDLKKYPRTLDTDIPMLKKVKCDVLFAPDVKEMYPPHPLPYSKGEGRKKALHFRNEGGNVDFGNLDKVLEGKFRPGHFKGVATVVDKLFGIVESDKAYFGKKDYQQVLVIKKMVEVLNHKVKIIPCATIREKDGLAMSSRNMRLTSEGRKAAPFIYQTLKKTKKLKAKMSVEKVKEWAGKEFAAHKEFTLEYFEISDADTLIPLKKWNEAKQGVACIAAFLGNVRLIDNIEL